ncbi:amino acid permease [Clostridium sp. A1-XYC3]|uniref:Amino acid permease n=1 Tax=Clostridium tanneri TaxID=3037988 RepID=A0ABU4JV35_9CLOT|nr:amino acid permease [Clostridium sp. A1-XYC3]MDW8801794.1 amino acid permease [Clostridium sp. A1-XYC3]
MSNEFQTQNGEGLERGLEERHIKMMAIGGAIGVGLFLGSATAIQAAGPAILFTYAVAGVMIFFIMRSLGEMAVEHPVAGSFSAYANDYVSPLAGYLTGWTYWIMWVVTCMAEVTAVGIYMTFWFPNLPQWISALVAVCLLTIVNLTAASAFGEIEFWFALIKVATIVIMIVIGLAMIMFGLGNNGVPIGISKLTAHGGFFPKGIMGPISTLTMVSFAFVGVELIGVTAGEAKNPEKVIPTAINSVFIRIMIFYIGALFVIMSLYAWDSIGTKGSPFVLTFSKLGIAAAAGIINFVVLTAASSSCNSGIFTTGRMLYNLSLQGQAPKVFGKLNKNNIPQNAILTSVGFMLIGVILNYVAPGKAFTYVTSVGTFAGIFAWFMIVYTQIKFRKSLTPEQVSKLRFKTVLYPASGIITMIFLVGVFVSMLLGADTRIPAIVGVVWMIVLLAAWYGTGLSKKKAAKQLS